MANESTPKHPQLDKAGTIILDNLKKKKIPESARLAMAQGKLPSGADVPFEILLELSHDDNKEVKKLAKNRISEFYSDYELYSMLLSKDISDTLLGGIISYFSPNHKLLKELLYGDFKILEGSANIDYDLRKRIVLTISSVVPEVVADSFYNAFYLEESIRHLIKICRGNLDIAMNLAKAIAEYEFIEQVIEEPKIEEDNISESEYQATGAVSDMDMFEQGLFVQERTEDNYKDSIDATLESEGMIEIDFLDEFEGKSPYEIKLAIATGKTDKGTNVPLTVLLKLANDKDEKVRTIANETLSKVPIEEVTSAISEYRVSADIIKVVVDKFGKNEEVIKAIAKNKYFDIETTTELCKKFPKIISKIFLDAIINNPSLIPIVKIIKSEPTILLNVISLSFGIRKDKPTTEEKVYDDWLKSFIAEITAHNRIDRIVRNVIPLQSQDERTIELAKELEKLSPEEALAVIDGIRTGASIGRIGYDDCLLCLTDIDIIERVMDKSKFEAMVKQLKSKNREWILKVWAGHSQFPNSIDKIREITSSILKLAVFFSEKFKAGKEVFNSFHSINLIQTMLANPDLQKFKVNIQELALLFLGNSIESYHISKKDEKELIQKIIDFGFTCSGDGYFIFDITKVVDEDELSNFRAKLAEKEQKEKAPQKETTIDTSKLSVDERKALARKKVPPDVLKQLLFDPNIEVVKLALNNPGVTEREILVLALDQNTPTEVLEIASRNAQWMSKYPIQIAIINNRNVPIEFGKSLIPRFLPHDLVRIIHNTDLPPQIIESARETLRDKVLGLPTIEKAAMAEKASREIINILIDDYNELVTKGLLKNPSLTEKHILIIVDRKGTSANILSEIAKNHTWTSNRTIRMALITNPHLPASTSIRLLKSLSKQELKTILSRTDVPMIIKKEAQKLIG